MQKKIWKNLLLVVVMAVLCVAVGMTASAERAIVDSGECGAEGDNVIWTLYDDGELVISGEGAMKDYGEVEEDGSWGVTYTHWGDNATKLTIETGITKIGNASFAGYDNLVEIEISNTVVEIGELAFYECTNIKNITIPDSVNKVGSFAFRDCGNLLDITIPKNVDEIGCGPFVGCSLLEKIVVSEENNNYCSDEQGVLYSIGKKELIQYPNGSKNTSYSIADSTNVVHREAFARTLNLVEIKIPDNVLIDRFAFELCFRLEKIIFPEVTSNIELGCGSFAYCMSLDKIKIPAGVTLQENTFQECYGLREVYISNNAGKIGRGAILYSLCLEKIYVEGMTTEIEEFSLGASEMTSSGLSREEIIENTILLNTTKGEISNMYWEIIYNSLTYYDTIIHFATIYCHAGSTAEAYAIENGAPYVLTHFFEGEWTYDYDNMIRYRKCIHCDELETEALETTGDSDVEIIEPVDPDTDFTVDVVEDYVIIEETISNNITTDFEIVKAFDINLKNKDGVHVQPDGTVKVKLPLDWSKDGVYKVYRVNDDGTLTDMNAYRQGSHMVFDTDHFSIYVIVDESEKSDTPVTPDEPQEETKDNFFTRLLDLIKSFFDLIMSWFKK